MGTPAAFQKLLSDQKAQREAAQIRADREQKFRNQEEDALVRNLRHALNPYDGAELPGDWYPENKYKVRIEFRKNVTVIFFDDFEFIHFIPQWSSNHCSCENVCDHEWTYSLSMDCTEFKKNGKYGAYFMASKPYNDEEYFARSMQAVLKDYEWEYGKEKKNKLTK